jgi:hypothetical protein
MDASAREDARPAGPVDEENPFGKPPKDLPGWRPGPATRAPRGEVRVVTIDLARRSDRSRFLEVADAIQRRDPNYISPLRMERMKFLDTARSAALGALEIRAMVARRGRRDVGRITAHVDRAYDAYHGVHVAWFGFFESIDDPEVAHALLDEAVSWAKAKGATEIIGPMNFTTNHQVGMLVENFGRPPCVEMTYNPPYYERLVTSYGFGKAKDLLAWWIDVRKGTEDPKMRRYHEVSEKAKRRYGLEMRAIDMSRFEEEVARLFKLYNDCWQRNWGFVPVSEREFKMIARDLKPIVRPELVLIVEDKAGAPVAFSVCLPDINEVMPRNGRLLPFGWWKLLTGMKRIRYARLFTLGVLPSHRRHGIEGLLCIETALRAARMGMHGGEIGWTLEDNLLINRTVESFGGKLDRRYRLFGLDLR